MAINIRKPHLYEAEYVTVTAGNNLIREVVLFNRSQSVNVNYTDAAAAVIVRGKGFEDTNMTEDGRVTETGIIVRNIGVGIRPGPEPTDSDLYAADIFRFYERGYAELILNESQVAFTARLKDLVPRSFIEANGAMATTAATTTTGSISAANKGHLYPADGIQIPKGVRFRLVLRWDRPLILPSALTPRIEAELWGDAMAGP